LAEENDSNQWFDREYAFIYQNSWRRAQSVAWTRCASSERTIHRPTRAAKVEVRNMPIAKVPQDDIV
jgi:hypothetical protein